MNLKPSVFAQAFPDLPAVAGVRASTMSCGFYSGRGQTRDDVFLFSFPQETSCAGVFTQSSMASADVYWCREALIAGQGKARALIVNAGNSNAFTGKAGVEKNTATLNAVTKALNVPQSECFLAATGVIGEPLDNPDFIGQHVPSLHEALAAPDWQACARAFMTTDTFPKGSAAHCEIDGQSVKLAGIAKGSGMIAPNMATMLAYVFTDAAIEPSLLQEILNETCAVTFNAITVDGDTSTSDTLMVFATGQAGHAPVQTRTHPDFPAFQKALRSVLHDLALQIVKDGEGASKLIKIEVKGAKSDQSAKTIGASIANSPLVKTALAASDANWGRIVMAVGKSGEPVDQNELAIWLGPVMLAEAGARARDYDEARATDQALKSHIDLHVRVGDGPGCFTVYTCDLTHAYIEINGAYRT